MKSVALATIIFGVAGLRAAGTDDGVRLQPGKILLPPAVVREFIIRSVETEPELRPFFDVDSLRTSLPPFYDILFPGDWPNWPEIGSGIRGPAVRLGEWNVVFGAREMLDTEGMEHSPFVLQRVRLLRKKYFVNDSPTEFECTEINLDVKPSGTIADWKEGRVKSLELAGWMVLNYQMTDHGSYARGNGARCLGAGGTVKLKAGEFLRGTIIHEAPLGHIERVIPVPVQKPSGARSGASRITRPSR